MSWYADEWYQCLILRDSSSKKELCHKRRYLYLEGTRVFHIGHEDLILPMVYGSVY